MHEAFEAAPILEKLPLIIESITSYDDKLLVGTKQGHLLVYTVSPIPGNETSFNVSLERSNKAFSKKPITQLVAVPEAQILISLSDNVVSVHDLTVFAPICTINKSRGATLFEVDVKKQKSLTGDVQHTVRMCVIVKRKVQLYYWKNREFHELQPDLGVPDLPKVAAWCKDSICVGFKRDYFLIMVDTGGYKELFPTGKSMEPRVTRLDDNGLAVGRDEQTIFIDAEGNPTKRYALTWSALPQVLVNQPPYVIAVLPKVIEIRTVEPRLFIQSIEVNQPKFICHGSNHVYVASTNHVWRLASTPITSQIKQLLQNKEFELALHLANMTQEADSAREGRIQHIQTLYAFDLFSQHRFEESLQMFTKLGTDASHVIGLYPNLLPQDFRNQLEYPDKLPDLEGAELEKGLLALIEYLTTKRNEVMKEMNKEMVSSAIVEGSATIKSKRQLTQILDTSLLKCYLQTNDALVAPLLRLKDNNCHIEETERVLKKHQKFSELIILYEKKGLHKKALDLLLRQAQKHGSPLKGHDRTVQYLQRLGADHLDLIFEYAGWVLKTEPEDGLKIFTEDLPEVENLPRQKVLDYLEKTDKNLMVPYLEHVIMECNDDSENFHNALALSYKDKVQSLMSDYLASLPEGEIPARAGKEPSELGELRRKLLFFLETQRHYVPERLLAHFPFDSFFEERAILLGRLGRHEQALAIYVHILHDNSLAKQYCKLNYDRHKEGNKDVYIFLLKMFLSPPDAGYLGIMVSGTTPSEPNIDAALDLLRDHGNQVNTSKALELLPASIEVSRLLVFLENVLEERGVDKRDAQVLRSLLYAEHLQVQEQRMFYQKIKCIITDEKMCRVCKKRIGNSAFARYPNGVIVHYYCCKDPKVWPSE
ncbi:unnamed protein product [Owenia fusiformis]|uniref:Uncharacterized protein n=1 Tax=Owenia fusiformis TaxID=6347 RepID=A0A8J1U575_OWEFU|nr:unnamed protein product [Owenia fusiformis]